MSNQNMYEGYDSWKDWDVLFSPTSHEIDLFCKEFKNVDLQKKSFLDVGFGSGSLLEWAKGQGALVSGIEVQERLLTYAANRGVAVFKDFKNIPDNTFDVVTAFDVLEHVSLVDLPKFMGHLYRVAAPGGQLFLRFPNCQSPAGLAIQFGDHTHVTMLSGPLVRFMLKQAGCDDVVYRSARLMRSRTLVNRILRLILKPITSLFLFLYRLVLLDRNTPMAPNIMVIAIKPKG